jgi:hypothetical protein
MVEFPLVGPVRHEGRHAARFVKFYLGYRCLPTKFGLTIGTPNPLDMWETNTSAATFHARLNVALGGNPDANLTSSRG